MAYGERDIEWVCLAGAEAPHTGELVSCEPGGMPIYKILSFADGRAWLRDLEDGAERLASLARFHWKALPREA